MAQLKSTVVQGSLRVTDTTYTSNLNLSSATASQFVKTDINKNLITGTIAAADITSGTLTVEQGGTGATTAAGARANLLTATGNGRIFYGTCDSEADAINKIVLCEEYDALTVGDVMIVTFTNTNTTNTALKMIITNASENATVTTEEKDIKCQVVASIVNIPAVGYLIASRPYMFVYDGQSWVMMNVNRDNNDDYRAYYLRTNNGTYIASRKLYRYKLLFQKDETTMIPVDETNYTSATTATNRATITAESFLIFGKYGYYSGTSAIEANTAIGAGNLWFQYALDLRYTFNTGSTLTTNKDVYLVATPAADGIHATLRNPTATGAAASAASSGTGPITQSLPTEGQDSNYIYIKLGHAYSAYQITLYPDHPVYQYKNGILQKYVYPDLSLMSGGVKVSGEVDATRVMVNGTNSSYNLYVSGNSLLANSITSGGNLNSQLIVSNPNGGDAAIELWRDTNASWQIANVSGTLYIRNNYTTTRQTYYSQNGIIMDYNTSNTAIVGTLAVGRSTRSTSDKLYVNGNSYLAGNVTATGNATVNGKLIGTANLYGATLPSSGTTGQIFFQTSDVAYELPTGGTAGQLLVKNTATDRDVIWSNTVSSLTATGNITAAKVFNAVWNDYAECRQSDITEPGRVIVEKGNGEMILADSRLMPGCKIISDTYGTLMGESWCAKTPVAVAGRVLAYPYKDKSEYKVGDAVCSAPGGTVDIMTREEIREYPERILGTVSEIPDEPVWYAGTAEDPIPIIIYGRIWIYVR